MPWDGSPNLGRESRGAVGYAQGLAAENQVERAYLNRGARLLERRWRGRSGEIDLIFEQDDDVIMVEVKSSRTHSRAAEKVLPRQIARLMRAAEEFLGTLPRGLLTPMRLDVALVDGTGHIEILENALMDV